MAPAASSEVSPTSGMKSLSITTTRYFGSLASFKFRASESIQDASSSHFITAGISVQELNIEKILHVEL